MKDVHFSFPSVIFCQKELFIKIYIYVHMMYTVLLQLEPSKLFDTVHISLMYHYKEHNVLSIYY